jgi:hypothetical protein
MTSPRLNMSKAAITERIRRASAVSDLSPERRLEGKIDMTPKAITARLREAAALLDLCGALSAAAVKSGRG